MSLGQRTRPSAVSLAKSTLSFWVLAILFATGVEGVSVRGTESGLKAYLVYLSLEMSDHEVFAR
jgi:hypothetical protein